MSDDDRKALLELRLLCHDMTATLNLKTAAMRSGNDALKQVANARIDRIRELQRRGMERVGFLGLVRPDGSVVVTVGKGGGAA